MLRGFRLKEVGAEVSVEPQMKIVAGSAEMWQCVNMRSYHEYIGESRYDDSIGSMKNNLSSSTFCFLIDCWLVLSNEAMLPIVSRPKINLLVPDIPVIVTFAVKSLYA